MDSKPIALDKANRDVSLFCLAKQISNDKNWLFHLFQVIYTSAAL